MSEESQIVLDVVEEISRELSPHHPSPRPTTELEVELGLGSLERLELIKRLENRLGHRVDERPIFTARYVADLFTQLPNHVETSSISLRPRKLPKFPKHAQSLLEALRYQVEHQGSEAAFVLLENDREAALPSYSELLMSARKISSGLIAQGVQPGDKVAIMLPTSVEFFTAFFGVINAGAVAVPLYPPLRLDQFEDFIARQDAILRNCQARVLITLPQFAPVAEVVRQRSCLEVVTSTVALSQSAPHPLREAHGSEIAMLQYTSGSTGQPKGVPLTHQNLLINIWAIGKGFGLGHDDVMVSWLPLYHDMGLIGMSLLSFVHGCPLVLMAPDQFLSRPSRWIRAFSDYRGSMTAAPNFAYAICATKIRDQELEGLDLSCWRVALNGAEPVIPATVRAFNERFKDYGFSEKSAFPAYGLAEATLAVSFTPLGRGLKTLALDREHLMQEGVVIPGDDEVPSCGVLVDDIELRIAGNDGPLPDGHQGHIELKGPSMMQGYLGLDPSPEWQRVGDLGFLHEGELYITGRSKDLIVVGGRNVHPNDLEAAASQVPGVRPGCVAALGVESEGTQKIVVLAEVRKATPELQLEIQKALSRVVSCPSDVVMLKPRTLPKTPSGKIRRQLSKERYLSKKLEPSKFRLKSLRHAASTLRRTLPEQIKRALRAGWCGLCVAKAWADLVVFKRPIKSVAQTLLRQLGIQVQRNGQPFGGGPLMVVANHASLLDGLILLATWEGEALKFVMAESHAHHPLLGPLARRHLLVKRGLGDALPALARMTDSLQSGACLAVFPEGGIEYSTGLRGFAAGAFRACTDAGARLQPVALQGTRQVLPQGQWIPKPGQVEVTYLDIIQAQETGFQATTVLTQQARASIAKQLDEVCRETRLSRKD